MTKLKEVLQGAIKILIASSPTAKLDAELLLAHALKKPRVYLYTHDTDTLSDDTILRFDELIKERARGMPIAYLVGEREFWSLPFEVTPDVLIPRPETEGIIELVLTFLGSQANCHVLELGTGTGAISVALAKEKPNWHIYAVEQSEAALEVAKRNIARHDVKNIELIHSNWFTCVPEVFFDAIISNPPYLASDDPHQHEGDVQFEPKSALLSGDTGLDDLTWIVKHASSYLKSGAPLILEHGYQQAEALRAIFEKYKYKGIKSLTDYAGHVRITYGFK